MNTARLALPGEPHEPRQSSLANAELAAIAKSRHVSLAACQEARRRGLLMVDFHRGQPAWCYGDSRNGCWRRIDGEPFRIGWREAKSEATTEGSEWHRLIGVHDTVVNHRRDVLLVEGSPDALAGFHFADAEGTLASIGILVALGERTCLRLDDLEALRGRRVRVIADATESGWAAAERWAEKVVQFAAEVQILDLRGLRRTDGRKVKDLNDATRLNQEDFDANRDLWDVTNLDRVGPRLRQVAKPRLNSRPFLPPIEAYEAYEALEALEVREAPEEGGGGKKEKTSYDEFQNDSSASEVENIEAILEGTIPTERRQTNRLLFELARKLRTYELKKNGGRPDDSLRRQAAMTWFNRATPNCDPALTWEDIIMLLGDKAERVRIVGSIIDRALEAAQSAVPLEDSRLADSPRLALLARVCREMGRLVGEFLLSQRGAARILGISDHKTAALYLKQLHKLGYILPLKRGVSLPPPQGKATLWKWNAA